MLSWLGLQKPIKKIGMDEMMDIMSNPQKYVLINTLCSQDQHCLIVNTISIHDEERIINDMLHKYDPYNKTIVVYGRNCSDMTVDKKYYQLLGLGFGEIVVYYGGLFEWLLLQDIYGMEKFPTTRKVLDILYYR